MAEKLGYLVFGSCLGNVLFFLPWVAFFCGVPVVFLEYYLRWLVVWFGHVHWDICLWLYFSEIDEDHDGICEDVTNVSLSLLRWLGRHSQFHVEGAMLVPSLCRCYLFHSMRQATLSTYSSRP